MRIKTVLGIAALLLLLLTACRENQYQASQAPSMDANDPQDQPDDDPTSIPDDSPTTTVPGSPTTTTLPTTGTTKFPQSWTAAWSVGRPNDAERNSWTEHLYQETERLAGPSVLTEPSDLSEFCPNWPVLDVANRRAFLAVLLSVMAKYESNFDPNSKYEESFKDAQGKPVVSRGLLQLSVESSNSYGCNVTATSLHQPKTNLSCGLRIINRWIAKDKYIGSTVTVSGKKNNFGGARYWSVLRSSSSSRAKIIDYLKNQTRCKK